VSKGNAIARAAKLFRGFRLRAPRKATIVYVDLPEAAILMGKVRAIEYEMPRGRRSVLYRHEFAKGSRPDLGAGPDRCQLVIVGGNYRVTHRGIVDLTPGGREIDD
jgi:hypothetical protein